VFHALPFAANAGMVAGPPSYHGLVLERLRAAARRDPMATGMILLLAVALVAWLGISYLLGKPLGAYCREDHNCRSGRCLKSLTMGYVLGGRCTQYCAVDADCPSGFGCEKADLLRNAFSGAMTPGERVGEIRVCVKLP
jgi:hypothetical protein